MGAQYLDVRIVSERFLHGLFRVMRLGAMSALGAGGGYGVFLGHGVSPLDGESLLGMDYS
jgi:hypothetical protein